VLLGAACGDALGVPYEFLPALGPDEIPVMKGGGLGPYEPGEYSDDTQMAVCIARVAATGADLRDDDALDQIADAFLDWAAHGASDIGSQTAAVLSTTVAGARPAEALRRAGRELHERTGCGPEPHLRRRRAVRHAGKRNRPGRGLRPDQRRDRAVSHHRQP
jgi:ADP-ribosylglycohydrolase